MIFDLVIYALVALAIVFGFNSGLLRSLATILGYLVAVPLALGTAPAVALVLATR
jgi:membrane protein required for colicin V production